MNEFTKAMEDYRAAFGEFFPTETYAGSESEMIALMRERIADGVPYEPQLEVDGFAAVY